MSAPQEAPPNLDLVLDVPVSLTAELGACRLPMGDVLQLNLGSVVQLEKLASDPIDLLVNGKRIARGEVVILEDHLGIKITELIAPSA